MCHSHSVEVRKIREQYCRDTLGNEEELEDMNVAALMKIELPFICNDIYDKALVKYPSTGSRFCSLELEAEEDNVGNMEFYQGAQVDQDDESEIILIFSVVLVSREKHKDMAKGETNKKLLLRGKRFSRKLAI